MAAVRIALLFLLAARSTTTLRALPRRLALRGAAAAAAAAALVPSLPPPRAHAAPPRPYPSYADVAAELDAYDWSDGWPYGADSFARLDEAPDARFYEEPRFVTHVDDAAASAIRAAYAGRLAAAAVAKGASASTPLDVLDLASSWVSFLPPAYRGDATQSRVLGVGLNRAELAANPQLTEWLVQDLNASPALSALADVSFDAALCTVSVDYLTRPRELFGEVARLLRPGGEFCVAFSDRVFFQKAVALWTGASDLDHVDAVGAYFRFAHGGRFGPPRAVRVDAAPRVGVDPVFIVSALRLPD